MDTVDKLLQISSRIEHLENIAEWIAKETIHTDNGVSQTGSLICVLADQIREAVFELCREFEEVDFDENETIH